jgi:pimeloyl-ACP methyl ester carboxylesterase
MVDMSQPNASQIGESPVTFISADGIELRGTHVAPREIRATAVLTHGGGVDREEDGFYTRVAESFAEGGIASIRFDLRGHGESGGTREALTLAGVLNDIVAAVQAATERSSDAGVHLVGTSFGGGLTAMVAASRPDSVRSLTLFNPLIDYKRRFLTEKPWWNGHSLTPEATRTLDTVGWLDHGGVLRINRDFLDELFWIDPAGSAEEIRCPTLTVHGSADQIVPPDVAAEWTPRVHESRFVLVEGADHGFTSPGDETYSHPDTQLWQKQAIAEAVDWIHRFGTTDGIDRSSSHGDNR